MPIPGTTKLHRMEENIVAVNIELTAEELKEIEAACAKIKVLGNRYTEQMEKSTGLKLLFLTANSINDLVIYIEI